MTDVVLTLGSVTFSGMEVPDRIGFGGDQVLKVHRLVGGARVIDAMGVDDMPLEWSGRFLGPAALSRARLLDQMRRGGQTQTLQWSELAFTVVVRSFRADFEKSFNLPYSICCEVVSPTTASAAPSQSPSAHSMVLSDLSSLMTAATAIGNTVLSGNVSNLVTAVNAIPSLDAATKAQVASVLGPIAQAQTTVQGLIATADATMGQGPLGGFVAGASALSMVSALSGGASAAASSASLRDVSNTLGRMTVNLTNLTSAGQQIVQGGGDLYRLAVQAYGDVTRWTDIARANGRTDPVLAGINTLTVPATNSNSGGVLTP